MLSEYSKIYAIFVEIINLKTDDDLLALQEKIDRLEDTARRKFF